METPYDEASYLLKEIPILFPIFQKGFGIRAYTGCSVHELLVEQWGLSSDYLRDRISIVFLDGKPLDDLDSAVIREGSCLVLSGAMPGLVGAAMKRGSVYSTLRSSITHRGVQEAPTRHEGFIRIKLFNLLMQELGPVLLERGIYIAEEDLGMLPASVVQTLKSEGTKTQAGLEGDVKYYRFPHRPKAL